jgi:4-hydroxy-tetrahydrodipicolinate synthase
MLDKKKFKGTWVSTITPFNEQDQIMKTTISSLYEYLSPHNISGIIPIGPIGEFASLSFQEKVEILRTLGQEGGSMKIMPVIGETSIKTALKLAMVAESAGVDGLVLIAPYYFLPVTQPLLYEYFEKIIKASRLPIFIYHRDRYCNIPLSTLLIEKLNRLRNFYGIIDSGMKENDFNLFRKQFPKMVILSGRDRCHGKFLQKGADGIVSWMANAYPQLFSYMYDQFKKGKISEVEKIQDNINCLRDILVKYPHPDSIKYALYQRGFPSMSTRLPLDRLEEDQKTKLKTDLGKYINANLNDILNAPNCEDV